MYAILYRCLNERVEINCATRVWSILQHYDYDEHGTLYLATTLYPYAIQ
jgi:hypothetical protein